MAREVSVSANPAVPKAYHNPAAVRWGAFAPYGLFMAAAW